MGPIVFTGTLAEGNLTVIVIDDWLIWVRAPDGRIYWESAEVWPEWLDNLTPPENMGEEGFKREVLRILKTKVIAWHDFRAGLIESEIEYARNQGRTMTQAEAEAECAPMFEDLAVMEKGQAQFIASVTG